MWEDFDSLTIKRIFTEALPYIAKVAGGEAVLFDRHGNRIASVDSDGMHDAARLIHSPTAKKAMETMRPYLGPSVMDPHHLSVRIPLTPEFGLGFSNYFAVKYGMKSGGESAIDSIIGDTPDMLRCKKVAGKIAMSSSTTVLYGETGVGKDTFVRAMHNDSIRRKGPLIAVNCGSIPENLVESILFGYEEGAFTGAKKGGNAGIFEQAHGGSLFLDEIGEMSLSLQTHLLRVLQDHEVVRVGGKESIPVDVRVFAATNRDLQQLVKEGKFRQDLYFRLNVLDMYIPPLRERLGDIPELAFGIIDNLNERMHTTCKDISGDSLAFLMKYDWPGNIRELRNVIERALNMTDSEIIQPEDLPHYILNTVKTEVVDLKSAAELSEKDMIISVLESSGWKRKLSAEKLGISTTTLWRRMKALRIL